MVFFVMELKSRAVRIAGIRIDPDGAWMMQVARNLLDPVDGIPAECDSPDPRPRPALYQGVEGAAQIRRREMRAHPGT